ncbi:UDP-3-O-acylglucosamine N-acyltransferase [Poriferisphaera corsica]|uniref:UDP-3-O-acylglucosamine N-acyltransferase n=2 Tax=Poriferisphaera corsica TaxID=2528020 RepID=A0A517YPM7_9BACT|nr:UDP-3-O-acylglucosamine N-acyltransferase [Poriferisphaera corsica]
MVGGELVGDGEIVVESLEELEIAGAGQMTFIGSDEYAKKWASSGASAALVNESLEVEVGEGRALVFVENADLAMGQVLGEYAPKPVVVKRGVHATAVVDETAKIGQNVAIGAQCYVGPNVVVGDNTMLHPRVTVLDDVVVGQDCELWSGAVIRERCTVGDRCIIHPNAVIGGDGFGYRVGQGERGPELVKIPQIGIVEIQDDCEIGCNATIDRAKFSKTVVGAGTKIDNQVQIGHNVRIGQMCAISGATGIAGSVDIGNGVTMGGMCAIKDHISIGDGVTLGGGSQVIGNVPTGATWVGAPARDYRDAVKEYTMIRKMPDLYKQFRKLLK